MTEITPSFIYWITRLDQFDVLTGIVAVVSILSAIVFMLIILTIGLEQNTYFRFVLKGFKISLFICIISTLIHVFIPTTKQACAMYVVPKIANNEKVQDIGKEFYDLALDWMKELHPKSVQNKGKSK